jgi:exosortase J
MLRNELLRIEPLRTNSPDQQNFGATLSSNSRLKSLLDPRLAIALACICAAAGLFTVYSSVATLMDIWRTDDLKSMGLMVPFISFALILRAWRSIGWETEGSWSGFAILAASAVLMFLRDRTLFIVTVNKNWLLQLPPLPLIAVAYAAGIVLLFGGKRLLRAAWFPVLFMWAVIPVPQTFSSAVDLPLQHASATVVRGFAHLLGQQLTQTNLRLMFTPEFGLFIAPGCNGIRGAITLGMAAVVVGYIYRFRWYVYAPVVAGSVLLGYLFNFLRLCLLVVYYKIALPHPWLQVRAKTADYIIGGCLFVCALTIFFTVANKLRRDPPEDAEGADLPATAPLAPRSSTVPYLAKVAAILVLAAIFGFDALHTHIAETYTLGHEPMLVPMPQQLGGYKLVRSWQDSLIGGTIVYTWGEYADGQKPQSPHIALGISPVLGVHDAEVCHIARGEEPTWHGQIAAQSPSGPVELTAATYNDGTAQRLEASTVCDGGACRQFSQTSQHVTLVYSYPHKGLPMQADTSRSVPVLLKVEALNPTASVSAIEPQLAAALTQFLKSADLASLTTPYSKQ